MRSIQRMLTTTKRKISLVERERLQIKLGKLNSSFVARQLKAVEKQNRAKYREVRFYEKKKVMKILNRARKISDEANRTRELNRANELLNYILHFPMDRKYISLFKNFNTSDSHNVGQQKRLERERNGVMDMIRAKIKSLAVVTQMDEGRQGRSLEEFRKDSLREVRLQLERDRIVQGKKQLPL
mmetsp:Transcript_2008/g.3152  ORF Transcript_2008/g.3152 Transcript_2008/m.3152 type:complete len:184 (+) Transcript_2008:377-928(+)